MIRLFYVPFASSLASHIALEESGASFEAVRLKEGDHLSSEYLAINPKGRVPAISTDRGSLSENVAILAWVAQAFPEARLAPTDQWEFAQAQSFNSYLATTVHVAHAHRNRGSRWVEEDSSLADMRRKLPAVMTEAFRLIETDFLKGPWVMGDTYSICDGYLFSMSTVLELDGVDLSRLPRVVEHRERVRARPAVQRVLARESG